LLQCRRRLAVQGEIQAPVGQLRGRLLRVVRLGSGRVRLAADRAGEFAQLPGLHRADGLRRANAVQLQSAVETGRLLPAERLAGSPQPTAAGLGLSQKPFALAALGRAAPEPGVAGL